MPFQVNPALAGAFNDVIGGLIADSAEALSESITNVFNDTVRPRLNWGPDHEIQVAQQRAALAAIVEFEIIAPSMRNRPDNIAQLSGEILPGIFESEASRITNDVSNYMVNGRYAKRNALGRFTK